MTEEEAKERIAYVEENGKGRVYPLDVPVMDAICVRRRCTSCST